ncbi:hypothetical protein [Mycolicibacterium lutetiense]
MFGTKASELVSDSTVAHTNPSAVLVDIAINDSWAAATAAIPDLANGLSTYDDQSLCDSVAAAHGHAAHTLAAQPSRVRPRQRVAGPSSGD